jgi:ATP-dependent helicase HrpB
MNDKTKGAVPLPIDTILPELKKAVLMSSSVVLHAPPGAGKTTRVPLALLDLIHPETGRIIMLEPRRIAAVSAARWMARVLGEEIGKTIGYSIRFDRMVSDKTRIEVVTEGILTRRMQSDPCLEGTAMVIFDEFHERSLHTDLALSLCIDLQRSLREDLKILVMSATLECGPILSLLGGAPVITSEGRIFPVEERYIPDRKDMPLTERIVDTVRTALKETSGDILVFLPGAGEIQNCSEALRPLIELKSIGQKSGKISLHPLYGDLPFEEQERAILPSDLRKIVLTTNIAETSLTIEGVQVVIDSGLTRRLQYDPSTGMNRLITVSVSKASAEQRKGRAGRLGPGVCFRLYSKHALQSMIPFAPPEILVSDLSSLVLELALWGVKNPSELSWLDAPPAAAWESARQLLTELGAFDEKGIVTHAGKIMAKLPLHPRLARLVQRAEELACTHLGTDLAALLSERDIILRSRSDSMSYSKEADIAARLDILRLWQKSREIPVNADARSLRSVERTSKQLMRLSKNKSSTENIVDEEMISRLLLCAFPDRVAKLREEGNGRFLLSQGRGVRLSPLSSLIKSPFIIAVNVDAGDRAEGFVHLAASLDEGTIRQECSGRIKTLRRIQWNKRDARIVAVVEDRLGAVLLSTRPFNPLDEEVVPLLCEAIRSSPSEMLKFTKEVRQFQGRVALMQRHFPEEKWPELSDDRLTSMPEDWLLPWLGSIRSAHGLSNLDVLPPLQALLSREQQRLLDERTPASIIVPSGSRIMIDYASGDVPVLAVKLQEMFGLDDTPKIAKGRVKILLHLLSPARRPVQITQDLKGFWNSSYRIVRKEMKGRYPKHPWPDDPWNAVPTRKAKSRGK